MELVNLLKSFSAKVQTTIKKEYSDNGSVTDNYEKAVDSNLPPSFTINIPIFKGAEPEKLSIGDYRSRRRQHGITDAYLC